MVKQPPSGSHDAHPPKLLWPEQYVFAVVAQPDRQFEVYRSRLHTISLAEISARLRTMADTLDIAGGDQ